MKIAVITGSRGDRGALTEVYGALWDSQRHSIRWIDVEPGISIRYPSDAASVAGITCTTVAGDLASFPADLVLLLGDRYEIAGAALGAHTMAVPIAHLSGGDRTEGSLDDRHRDAITAYASLHFPTNQPAAERIAQMGEGPDRITVAGWPMLDRLARTVLPGREETFAKAGLGIDQRVVLVCLHPDTLGNTAQLVDLTSEALKRIAGHPGISLVLVGPNNDAGNDLIRDAWGRMASVSPRVKYRESIEQEEFWALMSHSEVLVGNSSTGYTESPSMALPTVDIGDRQKGRISSPLLFNVPVGVDPIANIIEKLLSGEYNYKIPATNPYGDGKACQRILAKLDSIGDPRELLQKKWRSASIKFTDCTFWGPPG